MSTINDVAKAAAELLSAIEGLPVSAVTEVITVHDVDVAVLTDDLRTLRALGQQSIGGK